MKKGSIDEPVCVKISQFDLLRQQTIMCSVLYHVFKDKNDDTRAITLQSLNSHKLTPSSLPFHIQRFPMSFFVDALRKDTSCAVVYLVAVGGKLLQERALQQRPLHGNIHYPLKTFVSVLYKFRDNNTELTKPMLASLLALLASFPSFITIPEEAWSKIACLTVPVTHRTFSSRNTPSPSSSLSSLSSLSSTSSPSSPSSPGFSGSLLSSSSGSPRSPRSPRSLRFIETDKAKEKAVKVMEKKSNFSVSSCGVADLDNLSVMGLAIGSRFSEEGICSLLCLSLFKNSQYSAEEVFNRRPEVSRLTTWVSPKTENGFTGS